MADRGILPPAPCEGRRRCCFSQPGEQQRFVLAGFLLLVAQLL